MRRSIFLWMVLPLLMFLVVVSCDSWLKPGRSFEADRPVFYVAPNGSDTNAGTIAHPWATIQHAAAVLKAGETVYIRAGRYPITQQIRANHSGTENAWILYAAYPGERVIFDAIAVGPGAPTRQPPFWHDQGTFQLENVSYIQVRNLEIINSHHSGFTVRGSHHIQLSNNKTEKTFSPGIGVWESHHVKVVGNTVTNANTREMMPASYPEDFGEAPHEGISLGSVEQFEVAYNLVYDTKKEGIDIKGASQQGTVHHNYVHHAGIMGLYVDSWDGILADVEIFNN
ncbi:MAG TPA: right-handed parallel beta-helix repeat-containing protein, partial [Coleofasciculaceae cyanobacterium]